MYYTIIPGDVLFSNQKEDQFMYEERKYKNQIIQVIPSGENQVKIQRVIATDPTVYLSKDFEPGTIIDYSMTTGL